MKIVGMNKEYRYGHGGKAKVLVTNTPNKHGWCVISMDECGELFYHQANGRELHRVSDTEFNLIEVTPYDYLNDGDVVEIEYPDGSKMLRRWAGVNYEGYPRVYEELRKNGEMFSPTDSYSIKITLISRANTEVL